MIGMRSQGNGSSHVCHACEVAGNAKVVFEALAYLDVDSLECVSGGRMLW